MLRVNDVKGVLKRLIESQQQGFSTISPSDPVAAAASAWRINARIEGMGMLADELMQIIRKREGYDPDDEDEEAEL